MIRAAVLASALLTGCAASSTPAPSDAVAEQQRREEDAWRQGCESFRREVADKGGEPLRDPSQFPDVFDGMLRDAGAPESFRQQARDQARRTPPSPDADPEAFREYMEKFADKCSQVGTPIE